MTAILNFPRETGSRFLKPIFTTIRFQLGNIPVRSRVISEKPFWWPVWIFPTRPDVEFLYKRMQRLISGKSTQMPLKYLCYSSELWRNNPRTYIHTYIHTYKHTDRHTYIHTDRQTELKYYIRFYVLFFQINSPK